MKLMGDMKTGALIELYPTTFRPIWMRFGARVSKTLCQNGNPWVQVWHGVLLTRAQSHPIGEFGEISFQIVSTIFVVLHFSS